MKISELKDKKIAILGFGLEGQSTLRFLESHSFHNITVLDKNMKSSSLSSKGSDVPDGEPFRAEVNYIFGEDYLNSLDQFDVIFKSPGISPFGENLLPYREKFTSQTEIFFSNYTGKVIGITGTKGKSTCSTLLYTCLQEAGYDVKLVGNIGKPVLDEIDFCADIHDYVIYELSSYMLQDFTPKLTIGILNNIYPCHLDWHYDSFNIYKQAKVNILRNAEYKIINTELSHETEILEILGNKIFFGASSAYTFDENGYKIEEEYIFTGEQKLLGEHNKRNILAVITTLDIILTDREKLIGVLFDVLPEFGGLPHRIENIGTFEGITFIDDAIATTPESTTAAIHTFEASIQSLFLGGEDSGFDFSQIRGVILASNIENIIAFPDTSEKIFPEIELRDYEKPFEIEIEGKLYQFIKTRSMKAGVDFAFRTTFPGKIALLSCGAPSFSLWKNYLEKAQEFKKEVQKY